jgi:hypothetical protein
MEMLQGPWIAQAIYAAAALGLADQVAAGPRRPEDLAAAVGAEPAALQRLLRALAGLGIFAEDDAGRFGLTPLAATLQSDVPGSMRAMALLIGSEWHWRAWEDFLTSVRQGGPAFDRVHGLNPFAFFGQHPEAGAVFDRAMTSFTAQVNAAIVQAYDFSGFQTLVDVGGGQGTLLAAILQAQPHLQGVLLDLPAVVEAARPALAAAGVAERCEIVAGDFFGELPRGGDAYLLKNIVHGWNDARAAAILQRCGAAMAADSRLLLVESVIPPGNAPSLGKLMDLEMLVMTEGGRERTEEEFRALLGAGGFQLLGVTPTRSPVSVIEGRLR